MNERVVALRVGIVVLAAAFVTAFLIILLGEGQSLLQGRYTIYLRFPQAPGVAVDTPVRKSGVLIGRVSKIELLDEGGVRVTARIDSGRKLYQNEVCYIRPSSLLGDSVLEFETTPDSSKAKIQVQDTELMEGFVAGDPIRMLSNMEGDVRRALQSFQTAADNFSSLSVRLNTTLGREDQLPRLLQKTELALDKFYATMDSANQLLGDDQLRERLKQGLADLPTTLEDMRMTMAKARESLDAFQSLQPKVERNLDNMEKFTKPLGDRGPEMVGKIDSILTNVNVMTTEVAELSSSIRNSDGTIAKLLRDDELYHKIDDTVDELKATVRRIRPIMDDIRVFSDKIATDPRQLGLKGALDKKPVGVGFKDMRPQLREPATLWQKMGVE